VTQLVGPRERLDRDAPPDAATFESVFAQTTDKTLVLSYGFRMGLAVGIVFLMTTQPELPLSLAALGTASLAGVVLVPGLVRDFGTPQSAGGQ